MTCPTYHFMIRGFFSHSCCHDMDEGRSLCTHCPAAWRPQSSYLPPQRSLKVAIVLPATLPSGGGNRCTCCHANRSTLHVASMTGILIALLAASPWMRGGDRHTCRLILKTTGGRGGPACCLAVDARRRSPYLLPRRECEVACAMGRRSRQCRVYKATFALCPYVRDQK